MVGDALLETHYVLGIERLDSFAAQFTGTHRLSEEDLAAYRPRIFSAGWDIPGLCEEGPVTSLRILVDTRFPFKPPRIAVYPPLSVLTYPNLEEQGCLCLSPASASFSVERIESLAMELLGDARQLVNDWYHRQGLERFEDEFNSYWNRWAKDDVCFISLCNPDGPSRWVYAFKNRRVYYYADEEKDLKEWLKNDLNLNHPPDLCRIPLIRLPRAPHPERYPDTVQKLFSLVDGDQTSEAMLRQLIREDQFKHRRRVLLSFAVRHGTGFAGLLLPPKDAGHIEDGFRKGHMPFSILMQRYDVKPVDGVSVTRCDPLWVHGRDNNPAVSVLQGKTVVILGIGSLGSGVAELLAKIGVGKLILVDPERMESENACRHSLGIDAMPLNKASAMASQLMKRFPHLKCLAYNNRWELQYRETPSMFETADLVISAIGSWSAESALNALARYVKAFPPILFGWLEPHAAAGHAIVFFKREQKCLRCMTDDMGRPRLAVTKWPEEGTLRSAPACGGMFQPYGATELAFVQGVVTDLATEVLLGRVCTSRHRVWVGQRKLHDQDGGYWHPDWAARYGAPGAGGFIKDMEPSADPICPICGRIPGE